MRWLALLALLLAGCERMTYDEVEAAKAKCEARGMTIQLYTYAEGRDGLSGRVPYNARCRTTDGTLYSPKDMK